MKKSYILFLTMLTALVACKSSKHADLGDGVFAGFQTSKGEIILKLEHEKTPVTVANFISLAEGNNPFVSEEFKGKKYYDGLIFHRIIKDFMIQGGDPTGTGSGNPGYKFKDEFHDSLSHSKKGILSMANSGVKTNGSQFFITHKETQWLDGKHTVFGEVIDGMDVVDSLANVAVEQGSNKPTTTMELNKVEIIRNGKEARRFDAVEIMTNYFAEEEEAVKAFEKMKADFLTETEKQKSEAEELPSGLKIYKITNGNGPKPKIGEKANVYYAGFLTDGTLFDSNMVAIAKKYNKYDERRNLGGGYNPTPMDYSPDVALIPGFREGLLSMKIGDKIRVFIPSHLGYGPSGSRNVIPPNADLIFDLEIVE